MPEALFPQSTKRLAQKRHELAPEIEAAFNQFSRKVFKGWSTTGEDKAADRRSGRACHSMPLLHSRSCEGGTPQRRELRREAPQSLEGVVHIGYRVLGLCKR